MVRTTVFSLFLFLLGGSTLFAQGLRVNGYAGYVFDDSFDNYYSPNSYMEGKIRGGLQWGAGLEYMPSPFYGIELLYWRQDTEVDVRYWRQGEKDRTAPLGINYVLIGGSRYAPVGDRFEGYGGFLGGMVIYSIKEPEVGEPSSVTRLALGLRLGGTLWATEQIGLKVQTQFMSAIQGFGGSFYFGTGGAGAGVNTYSTVFQFGLGGGIVLRLGNY